MVTDQLVVPDTVCDVPSIVTETLATASSGSDAVPDMVGDAVLTNPPLAGDVIDTVGAVVSTVKVLVAVLVLPALLIAVATTV